MALHRVYLDEQIPQIGESLFLNGEEARHAVRAKRLTVRHTLELLDGEGTVATAVVTDVVPGGKKGAGVEVLIESRDLAPRPDPWVEVWAAAPKGGRVDELVDGLSQAGAASWTVLNAERSVVDPRTNKLDRLGRVARAAAKQCGRPWLLELGEKGDLAAALASPGGPTGDLSPRVIVADASGGDYTPIPGPRPAAIRLIVGPEGGLSDAELARCRDAGAEVCRFGPHTMRIELAAIVGSAIVINAEHAADGLPFEHGRTDTHQG